MTQITHKTIIKRVGNRFVRIKIITKTLDSRIVNKEN